MSTLSRHEFLRSYTGDRTRPPAADLRREDQEHMMGWMSLRLQVLRALAAGDEDLLARYVVLGLRQKFDFQRLFGVSIPDERPRVEVVTVTHLGPGAALYTVREREQTALGECLFPTPTRLEADIQVTGGSDWLLRDLRPAF